MKIKSYNLKNNKTIFLLNVPKKKKVMLKIPKIKVKNYKQKNI